MAAAPESHAILEHALCGVRQSAVDVTGVTQSETVGSVLTIVKHVTCGLVDGHCTGIGCGVGLFLSYMKLQSLEMIILLTHSLFLSFYFLFLLSV